MRWYPIWHDVGTTYDKYENREVAGVRLECSNCRAEYKSLREMIEHTETCDGLNWDAARLLKFQRELCSYIARGIGPMATMATCGQPISLDYYRQIRPAFDVFEECFEKVPANQGIQYSDITRSNYSHYSPTFWGITL